MSAVVSSLSGSPHAPAHLTEYAAIPRLGNKTSPKTIAAQERAAKALELRKQGLTFENIAAQCGYAGKQGAFEAVSTAIRAITREPAEGVLALDLERLDGLFAPAHLAATGGDWVALSACLRIMERRAKLLGLDAPQKVQSENTTTHQGVVIVPATITDRDAWVASVLADSEPQPGSEPDAEPEAD